MEISGASMETGLSYLAMGMSQSQTSLKISTAVMKSIQDQQEQFANSLVQMIQQTPRPAASLNSNSTIDLYV